MLLHFQERSRAYTKGEAKVVIIGAGIVGASTAYHLTQMGWDDLVVLEQGPLFRSGGSSLHAPGLIFQTNSSKTMTKFAQYTVELYSKLSHEGTACYHPVGGIEVARTKERLEDLKRKKGFARSWEVSGARLVTPEEVKEKIPILDSNKIYGGFYVPTDGIAKSAWVIEALTRLAESKGATFYGNTEVTGVEVEGGQVRSVSTTQGRIKTNMILVCAGIWGPRIGRMAGVPIPLFPVQHQYVRTSPLKELAGETGEVVHPILRHQDSSMYFRQHADSYGIGSYHHEPILVDPDQILPYGKAPLMPSVVDFTENDFQSAWGEAVDLLPSLDGIDLVYKINGMFSFTPDGMPILGESQNIRGFWLAEAVWITHAGGVGKAIAEWVVRGAPSLDLRECDANRFHPHVLTPAYVMARAAQNYREVYDIIHPLQQSKIMRNLRLSPFQRRQEELGAVFFESAGWERPQWFEANRKLLADGKGVPSRSGWEAMYWSPIQGAEHHSTREGVVMFDLTAFTKIDVFGPKALQFLQHLSTNQIDQPVGKVVYTSMLNEAGGITCDLTITRLGPEYFRVLTGGSVGMHDFAWLRGHAPTDGSVRLMDVTSSLCCIGLWGPRAPEVMQNVNADDFSPGTFSSFTAREVSIGAVPALALQVSYVGESGWEIYAPSEQGIMLWDTIWKAGEPLGITAGGGGAFDSLRLEKAYRLWGADIHTEYNPYEAGLGFVVKLDKGEFLGREAVSKIKDQGISRKLRWMTIEEPLGSIVMGKEPILDGDRLLGYVTSANYGYSIGKGIIMGYLPIDYSKEGTRVEVSYFDKKYGAIVSKSLGSRYK